MKENGLTENLYTKHPLTFRQDGTFKVLMLSDIQEGMDWDPRTPEAIDRLVENVMPDLVMLGGDNCDHNTVKTPEDLKAYLDVMTAPMEKRRIPWAHVFGNHDHDVPFDDLIKTKIYESFPYCVSKHTVGVYGTTNFVLPIRRRETGRIGALIWGMDTNNTVHTSDLNLGEQIWSVRRHYNSAFWDVIHFDQLMWYWNTSLELEKEAGEKLGGMMVLHIAPHEAQYLVDDPEHTATRGATEEQMSLAIFNSGLFSTLVQRGDVGCVAAGHSHMDDFQGELCGITMCLDGCAGYSPYGVDALRGGRCFLIDEKDPSRIQTYMVHYQDL